jgi:hypothetical protein
MHDGFDLLAQSGAMLKWLACCPHFEGNDGCVVFPFMVRQAHHERNMEGHHERNMERRHERIVTHHEWIKEARRERSCQTKAALS